MRKFKIFVALALFLMSAVWLGIGLADTTAYNVADADSTWGVTLSQYRVCISVLAFDADASLQVYLDGTRLDSIPLPAGKGIDYWGQIDSFNIVRPTTSRAIVLLGAPDGRVCPSISGGAELTALETDMDNIYSRLDSVAKNRWIREVVYDGHDATVADTTFLTTGWGVADGGKIYLQVRGTGITGSGGEPLFIAKMIEEGYWNPLYVQSNKLDPTDTLVIADGSNSYNVWLITGFNSTLKSTEGRTSVFGDSICIILLPDDVSSGAFDITGRYQKE